MSENQYQDLEERVEELRNILMSKKEIPHGGHWDYETDNEGNITNMSNAPWVPHYREKYIFSGSKRRKAERELKMIKEACHDEKLVKEISSYLNYASKNRKEKRRDAIKGLAWITVGIILVGGVYYFDELQIKTVVKPYVMSENESRFRRIVKKQIKRGILTSEHEYYSDWKRYFGNEPWWPANSERNAGVEGK